MEWKYMLGQPEQLQSLAINSLAVWIVSQGQKLLFPILQLVKENPTKTKTMISSQIEIFRRHLYCNVPKKFYDTLLSKVIVNINNELIQNTLNFEPLTEHQRKIVGRMIETLFTENVTSLTLNFHQFVIFRESLYNNSQLLTNLVNVDISFSKKSIMSPFRSYYEDANEKEIIEFVKNLHNLKNLNLQYVCTDKILACITKNCKLIEKLDVFSSKFNDKSIKILTELQNLRIINISKTSVSNKGIEKLLLACKNLENVTHDGRIVLSDVMKKIASKEKNPKLFKLKTYRSCMDSLDQLKWIIRMSPHLQNIQTIVDNADAITGLKHLEELTLSRGGHYSGQVSNVLKVIGFNLVHLTFFQLSELNLNAVIDISQTCPNLESLSIEGCRFENSEINTQTRNKFEIVPFRKLKHLTLDMKDSFRPMELSTFTRKKLNEIHEPVLFLLANCVNIEFLECDIPVWLTEHAMLQILEHNPLICLQEMNLWSTRKLPLKVIEKIVQNCTNRPKMMHTEEGRRMRWI